MRSLGGVAPSEPSTWLGMSVGIANAIPAVALRKSRRVEEDSEVLVLILQGSLNSGAGEVNGLQTIADQDPSPARYIDCVDVAEKTIDLATITAGRLIAGMKPFQNIPRKQTRVATRRCFVFFVPILLMTLVWAGCKQDAKVTPTTSPVGVYNLVSIDGKTVPCDIEHEGHKMAIKSGSFSINPDGTCSSSMVLSGRDAAIEVKATYTLEGSTLTMRWQGAGTTTGTVRGDTFTMENEGMLLAYRK